MTKTIRNALIKSGLQLFFEKFTLKKQEDERE